MATDSSAVLLWPAQAQDQRVVSLPNRFSIRVREGCVQRAHPIGVGAALVQRVPDGGVEIVGGDFAGRALDALFSLPTLTAIIATRDAEGEMHVGPVIVHAHGGCLAGIERIDVVDDGLREGRALLAGDAILTGCTHAAAWDVKAEVQGVADEVDRRRGGLVVVDGVHRIDLRGEDDVECVDELFETSELTA